MVGGDPFSKRPVDLVDSVVKDLRDSGQLSNSILWAELALLTKLIWYFGFTWVGVTRARHTHD